jgi:ribosomal-protein-serine acetyltransferase
MFFYPITDSLRLRPLCLSDADELFALTDANRAYLRQWLPWLDAIQSAADTYAFIQSVLRHMAEGQGFGAAICHQGNIAGVIGYNVLDGTNRIGTIGYWLGEAYQGQGLMTAACRALVNYGFTELGLNRQVIACATENHRSQRIPTRLGFRHEGTLRQAEWLYDHYVDHHLYGCLKQDWQP